MQNGLNMEMVAYKVIETGHMIGYIEFVDNSEELSGIHKQYSEWGNWTGPYQKDSILKYVENKWKVEEEKMTVVRK